MAIKKSIEQNQNVQPNTELLQTLKSTLPQYFDAQGNFKLDKFESELKENNVAEARDGYRLGFVGKDYARFLTGQSSETIIIPDINHNSKPENINSNNVFITGDNLEALRHLQNAYSGKIKIIYIDPPYNTGKEFVYSDKFEFSDEKLKTSLGYGDAEIERLRSIQGKSSHSAWLTFMYPRLKLAQKLLTPDGVIYVSIDDNEQANLRLLLDDIFGEGNFINKIVWKKNSSGKTVTEKYPENIDYLFLFGKTKSYSLKNIYKPLAESTKKMYSKDDGDGRGKYRLYPLQKTGSPGPETTYDYLDNNGKIWKCPDKGWRMIQSKLKDLENDNRLVLDGDSLNEKAYWNERDNEGQIADTLWDDIAENNVGTAEVDALIGKGIFSNPKPTALIQRCIDTIIDNNDIVLDFFAGSGTTAHAVMKTSIKNNINIKFIMVQWPEATNQNSEAREAGYATIDSISRDRIIKAGYKIKEENPMFADSFDLGFKHYRLIEPDVKTINKIFEFDPNSNKLFEDDMITPFEYKSSNTNGLQTILQTWLTLDGYTFDVKVDSIDLAKYSAQYVRENAVLYLIDKGFSKDAMKALLNKIGKNEIAVNTLIVYPYSFSFEQMRELKNNLKNNIEQRVTIIERY